MHVCVSVPEGQPAYQTPPRAGGQPMAPEQQVALFIHHLRWSLASAEAEALPPERRRRWLLILAVLDRERRRLRLAGRAA